MSFAAASRAGNTRWKFFSLLFGMSFLSYALRQNMQVAGEQMMPELGISEIEMGWVFAAFVWGYTFFGLPGGICGERFGVRLTVMVCGVLWLLSSLLSAVVPGWFLGSTTAVLLALMVMRFLSGAFHAPIFPLVAAAIAAWFPVGRWGLPNSLSSAGCTLGAAATQPLVVWAMIAWGWQSAFYIFIPPGIALCALWWWYARDNPAGHPQVGASELALINAGREAMHAAAPEDSGAWKRLLRNRETLLLLGAYSSANFVFYLFFTWFFHYLVKVRGFSILETGFLAMLPWLAAAASATLGGWCCDTLCQRVGPRWGCRLPGMGGLLAAAVFLVAGLYVDDPYAAVAMLSLCFAAEQFTEASFWQAQTYVAPAHAASATGIMNTGANAAGMVVGPLVPWLATGIGWPAALSSGVLFALLGAVLWMFVRADCPLPAQEFAR